MVEAAESIPAPTKPQRGRTSDKTMATTLIGTHGLEHIYAHSFPVLVTAIYETMGLDPIQAGVMSAVPNPARLTWSAISNPRWPT